MFVHKLNTENWVVIIKTYKITKYYITLPDIGIIFKMLL